jgi:DNA-binding response OmpR family regulator
MSDSVYKVLFVEDDLNLGFVVKDQLQDHGFQVDWATKGRQGLSKALSYNYDIALLDVMLPEIGGFELAEEIVEARPELPFLFLTAKSMLEDKLKGLKLGSDYLTKPFEMEELIARMENILSANNGSDQFTAESQNIFQIASYNFDYINQYLERNGERQKLTKKEADLLRMLAINKNEVMNRDQALKAIWGSDDYFNGRSMDVFISKLRKYLGDDENIQIINVHGVGFKLATG